MKATVVVVRPTSSPVVAIRRPDSSRKVRIDFVPATRSPTNRVTAMLTKTEIVVTIPRPKALNPSSCALIAKVIVKKPSPNWRSVSTAINFVTFFKGGTEILLELTVGDTINLGSHDAIRCRNRCDFQAQCTESIAVLKGFFWAPLPWHR